MFEIINQYMKKPYYLLTIFSEDLIYESFEEKFKSKKEALEALENHKKTMQVNSATIRYCRDTLTYKNKGTE